MRRERGRTAPTVHGRRTAKVYLPPATIPDGLSYAWKSQAKQYPRTGRPGLSHEEHRTVAGTGPVIAMVDGVPRVGRGTYSTVVDCLLMRNSKGELVGILNHYRDDCYELNGELLEQAGNVNLWVRPNRQHRGIGLRLLAEADRRWGIDWAQQRYTEAGRRLAHRYLAGPS